MRTRTAGVRGELDWLLECGAHGRVCAAVFVAMPPPSSRASPVVRSFTWDSDRRVLRPCFDSASVTFPSTAAAKRTVFGAKTGTSLVRDPGVDLLGEQGTSGEKCLK